jgi:hypothetical protein
MNNLLLVQHVIVSHKEDGTPRHMSLHIPIDGKIRVHTVFPNTLLYKCILSKLTKGETIYIKAEFVTLECPIYYALITEETTVDLDKYDKLEKQFG